MISKVVQPFVTNALDRGQPFAEIARIFDRPIQEIESFSRELNANREDFALKILQNGGSAIEAEQKSGLSAMSIRAMQNRIRGEREEAARQEQVVADRARLEREAAERRTFEEEARASFARALEKTN